MNYNETISIATRPRGSEAVMSRHLGPWLTTFYRPRIPSRVGAALRAEPAEAPVVFDSTDGVSFRLGEGVVGRLRRTTD